MSLLSGSMLTIPLESKYISIYILYDVFFYKRERGGEGREEEEEEEEMG